MNTQDYRKKDLASLWHPYTRQSALESNTLPIIVRGDGVYLFDSEGHSYVDAISSWWACNLGHNHPRLIQAIERQARELQHSILGNLSHPRAIELAAKLAELLPSSPRRVFFSSDGASAVEAALKIAVQYWHNIGRPERNRFASFQEAYHGDTIGSVSVGYIESFHKQFQPMLFPVYRSKSPCCSTCVHGKQPATCALECFASMQNIFQQHSDQLAAVIVEPLCQGAAGMRMYSPKYLDRLQQLCRENSVLLIVDEIAMGFGRTGKMFAFQHAATEPTGVAISSRRSRPTALQTEHTNDSSGGRLASAAAGRRNELILAASTVDPDIVCMGKGLSGGYLPISAAVVKQAIYDTFRDQPEDHTFYHGHTFAGNPIACAAALETLRIYEEEGIVEQAAEMGRLLESAMSPLRDLPHVADVRALGMVAAVELGERPGDPAGKMLASKVCHSLFEKGILVRPLDNVVYFMPPLVASRDVIAHLTASLHDAIQQL